MVRKHVLRNKEIYVHRADEAEKVHRGTVMQQLSSIDTVNYKTLI